MPGQLVPGGGLAQGQEHTERALHLAACQLSASDTCPPSRGHQLIHVSGNPLRQYNLTASSSDGNVDVLEAYRLGNLGHELQYSGDVILGRGRYSIVVQGKEIIPIQSVPAGLSSIVHLLQGPAHYAWEFINPWMETCKSLLGSLPFSLALTTLATMTKEALERRFSVLGLAPGSCVKEVERAVKVLPINPELEHIGAYGYRSAEHEVLITLHVSFACAQCPHVGKAIGFEYHYLSKVTPATESLVAHAGGTDAQGREIPCALLLAMEPYKVQLPEPPEDAEGGLSGSTESCLNMAAKPVLGAPRAMSLADYLLWLKGQGKRLAASECKRYALQLAEALHALHTQAFVMHLDVKPHNALLDQDLNLKLVDFGFAAAFPPSSPYITLHDYGRGTPRYSCPEMVNGVPGIITLAADIYSYGCCLLTLCADHCDPALPADRLMEPYYNAHTGQEVLTSHRCGIGPQLPLGIQPQFIPIIEACLAPDPGRRPTVAQLLEALQSSDMATACECSDAPAVSAPVAHAARVPASLAGRPDTPLRIWQLPRSATSSDHGRSSAAASDHLSLSHSDLLQGLTGSESGVLGQRTKRPRAAMHRVMRIPSKLQGMVSMSGCGATPPVPSADRPVHAATDPSLSLPGSGETLARDGACSGGGAGSGAAAAALMLSPLGSPIGNTLCPHDLGCATDLRKLSSRSRSTSALKYTRSVRTGLAGVVTRAAPLPMQAQCLSSAQFSQLLRYSLASTPSSSSMAYAAEACAAEEARVERRLPAPLPPAAPSPATASIASPGAVKKKRARKAAPWSRRLSGSVDQGLAGWHANNAPDSVSCPGLLLTLG